MPNHSRFSFLTGVGEFSKVSLFSGLDNLADITIDPRYFAIKRLLSCILRSIRSTNEGFNSMPIHFRPSESTIPHLEA